MIHTDKLNYIAEEPDNKIANNKLDVFAAHRSVNKNPAPDGSIQQTNQTTNGGLMLGQRRRRWLNITPTLGQRILFVGISIDRPVAILRE